MRAPSAFLLPLCSLLVGVLLIGAGALAPAAGAVSFAPHVDYQVGQDPTSVAIGDLDGDGKQDLVVANMGYSSVSVLLGDGNGDFAKPSSFSVGYLPMSVAVADFNGDGFQDVATANQGSDDVSVLLGMGAHGFQTVASFHTGSEP